MADPVAAHQRVQIYGDESHNCGGRAVLGGLWSTPDYIERLPSELRAIRNLHGWSDTKGELKAVKCSGRRLHPVYRDAVRLVISSLTAGELEFRALIIDYAVLRHPQWHGGVQEHGIYRAWWYLLGEPMIPGAPHVAWLDNRTTREPELNILLTARGAPISPSNLVSAPVRAEFADSKKSEMLQLADVLVGAIGNRLRSTPPGTRASPAKIALHRAICYSLGSDDLTAPRDRRPFQVTRIIRHHSGSAALPAPVLPIRVMRSPIRNEIHFVTSSGLQTASDQTRS